MKLGRDYIISINDVDQKVIIFLKKIFLEEFTKKIFLRNFEKKLKIKRTQN